MTDVQWLYGFLYNDVTSLVVDPMRREEARQRHVDGDTYTVLLRSGEQNFGAVELKVSARVCNVYFFDEANRIYLKYGFGPSRDGMQMFLDVVSVQEWGEDHLEPNRHEVLSVKEDGTAHRRITDRVEGTFTEEEGEKPVDQLGINYEPVPEFGDYASLFRIEREKSVADQDPDSVSGFLRDHAVE